MTDREKLINLIHHARYEVENICNKQADCVGCPAAVCKYKCKAGYIADHLISNGVTLQMPEKPIKHTVTTSGVKIGNAIWGRGTTVYKCPKCGNFISRLYDYCYKCGQQLDWSIYQKDRKETDHA